MKKNIFILMLVISLLSMGLWADEKADFDKARKLFDEGKYQEALKHANEGIKKYGETEKWLYGKYMLLKKMERYEDALQCAIKREKIKKRKSCWDNIEIAELYLKLKKNDEAMKQLYLATDKGFQSYTELLDREDFKPLHQLNGFDALIDKIKTNVGIGKPPKDFTIKRLTGEDFTLSKYKGKVVLVDFWATWCNPCVKEIPNLKKDYAHFHKKGFEIIGISLDNKKEKLTDFIKKEDLKWMIAFSGEGWKDKTRDLYGVQSIPSTWLVDKKGVLRYFGLRGEKLSKAVETLIAE